MDNSFLHQIAMDVLVATASGETIKESADHDEKRKAIQTQIDKLENKKRKATE